MEARLQSNVASSVHSHQRLCIVHGKCSSRLGGTNRWHSYSYQFLLWDPHTRHHSSRVLVHWSTSRVLQFTLLNIIYVNHDVEELSSLTLSLSVPCELIVEETQWLMKAFLNSWIRQMASSMVCNLQQKMVAGRPSILLLPMTKPAQGYLDHCLACSLCLHEGKTVSAIFLTMLSVGIIGLTVSGFCMLLMLALLHDKLQAPKIHTATHWLSYALDHHHWLSFTWPLR